MRLRVVNADGSASVYEKPFGTKIVGQRYNRIDLNPEEIMKFMEDDYHGPDLYQYLYSLTKQYKKSHE